MPLRNYRIYGNRPVRHVRAGLFLCYVYYYRYAAYSYLCMFIIIFRLMWRTSALHMFARQAVYVAQRRPAHIVQLHSRFGWHCVWRRAGCRSFFILYMRDLNAFGAQAHIDMASHARVASCFIIYMCYASALQISTTLLARHGAGRYNRTRPPRTANLIAR